MTIRNLTFSIDEFYHLYSRGVDKRVIFFNDQDQKRFVRLLFLCNGIKPVSYRDTENKALSDLDMGEKLVAIGAYCLMPNHFHILVKEITDGGTVKFMSKLLTAYSSYFNKKYDRTGALFSSEFKSVHVENDEYLKYLFAYIHLNPLKILDPKWKTGTINKNTASNFINRYEFSSHNDYVGSTREEIIILNKKVFPQYFENKMDFENQMYEWINLENPRALPSVD